MHSLCFIMKASKKREKISTWKSAHVVALHLCNEIAFPFQTLHLSSLSRVLVLMLYMLTLAIKVPLTTHTNMDNNFLSLLCHHRWNIFKHLRICRGKKKRLTRWWWMEALNEKKVEIFLCWRSEKFLNWGRGQEIRFTDFFRSNPCSLLSLFFMLFANMGGNIWASISIEWESLAKIFATKLSHTQTVFKQPHTAFFLMHDVWWQKNPKKF